MLRFIKMVLIGVFAIGILIIGYLGYIEYRKQIEKPRNPRKILYHYVERKPLFPDYERVLTTGPHTIINNQYCMPMATRDELFNFGVIVTCLNQQEFLFLGQLQAYVLNGLPPPGPLPEAIKKLVPVSLEQKFQYFLIEKTDCYDPCAARLLKTSDEKGLCQTFTNAFAVMILQVSKFGQNGKFSGVFAHKSIIWKKPYTYI